METSNLFLATLKGAADGFHESAMASWRDEHPDAPPDAPGKKVETFAAFFLWELALKNHYPDPQLMIEDILGTGSTSLWNTVGAEKLGYLLAMSSTGEGVFWGQDAGQEFPEEFEEPDLEFYYDDLDNDSVSVSVRRNS